MMVTDNGRLLAFLFKTAKDSTKNREDIVIQKEPIIGDFFKDAQLIDRKNVGEIARVEEGSFTLIDRDLHRVPIDTDSYGTPQFPHNWMRDPLASESSFKMTITSSSLVLIYKDTPNAGFGKTLIYVDGKHVRTADPRVNDWIHCNSMILYREDEVKEHEIEIKMSPDDASKSFTILGFGYTL